METVVNEAQNGESYKFAESIFHGCMSDLIFSGTIDIYMCIHVHVTMVSCKM